jgi:hypothetical protein
MALAENNCVAVTAFFSPAADRPQDCLAVNAPMREKWCRKITEAFRCTSLIF